MEEFWERKGVMGAFVWIVLGVTALTLFIFDAINRGFAEANWLLLCILAAYIDRIVFPLANLPEPPRIFTFLTGLIPAGLIIAYFVLQREAADETQHVLQIVLFIALLLWNAANIGWGIFEKKKQNKESGL